MGLVQCASRLVLVEKGQSGQSYRMCSDFTNLNPLSAQQKYPMQDVDQYIDESRGYNCWSILEIKAGFNNVVFSEWARKYLGISSSDGLFRYLRMPFGLLKAPGWFQFCMDTLLAESKVKRGKCFVDNFKLWGMV